MPGLQQMPACLCQNECAGSKCCLCLAYLQTPLPNGCSLLIAGHARNFYRCAKKIGYAMADIASTIDNLWQDGPGHIKKRQQRIIPAAAANGHKRRSRSIGCIAEG